ncbi:MAG: hypothetical protein JWN43_3709 [Gammaproteobacteria bacterium]|nr:hypothetical protein [Gammaproteobacteria bacterium]
MAAAETTTKPAVPFMVGVLTCGEDGAAPQLVTGRCQSCSAYSFPQREICANCGPGPEVNRVTLSGEGAVYASTVVRVPSPVGIKSPYSYGYVDLDAAPLRVFALFGSQCLLPPRPGTRVQLVTEPLCTDKAGQMLFSHRFVPAPSDGEGA